MQCNQYTKNGRCDKAADYEELWKEGLEISIIGGIKLENGSTIMFLEKKYTFSNKTKELNFEED